MTELSGFFGTALSIAMLAAFALAIGGIALIVKKRERQRGWLMIGVALVLVINVLIWAIPSP